MVDPTTVDRILGYAVRAPSVHNTQPWRWQVGDHQVLLRADLTRRLSSADPDGRDLVISCGAALHHFAEAARALGWRATVHRCPRPEDEWLLAAVDLAPGRPPSDAPQILDAIVDRRTDRRRLTSWPVPPDRLDSLCAAGSRWGAEVRAVTDETRRAELERLTRRAEELQSRDPAYEAELATSTTYWSPSGVPVTHVPRAAGPAGSAAPDQRFRHGVLDDPELERDAPGDELLLVTTSSDDTLSRLRAGEALSAVWLHATRERMSLVPLSQAIEVPETRALVQREVLDDRAVAQLVLRVGWPALSRRMLPSTPRRDVDEVRVRGL